MKFEDSTYSKQYNYVKKTLDFGEFYFLNEFVISEMNEGIHLSWNNILEIIEMIQKHYGKNCSIGYISNKINSYSFDPNHWKDFFKKYNFLVASVSVYYSNINFINASIEKLFSSKSLKRTDSLNEAIQWIMDLEELKNN